LAGEPAADEIDRSESLKAILRDLRYVAQVRHVGPMLRQDPARVGVDLRLSDDGHAGALEAEVQAPDPAE